MKKTKYTKPLTEVELYNLIKQTPNDSELGKLIRERYGK